MKSSNITLYVLIFINALVYPLPSHGFPEATNNNSQQKPASELAIFGGPVLSNIGSGAETAVSLGFLVIPRADASKLQFAFGAEYSRSRGYGSLRHFNTAMGDWVFLGEGEVILHFVDLWAGWRYRLTSGKVKVAPRFGVGPSFLAHTTVHPAPNPVQGEFRGIDWYRSLDLWGHVGMEVRWRDLVLYLVFKQGLSTLHDPPSSNLDGGPSTTVPFTPSDMRYQSLRLGVGYVF